MNGLFIYKSLAYADELRTMESSEDEFQQFLMGVSRPDFADKDVLCVKFLFAIIPDSLEDAEETSWFINPNTVKVPPYCARDIYGAKLPEDYPPYLLLLASRKPQKNILFAYDMFLAEGVTGEHDYRTDYPKSLREFSDWYSKNPY